MGKNVGKYPEGPINQHKSLATGAGLRKGNTSDKETVPSPWGEGTSHPGEVHSGKTGTGSGRGTVPKSTFTKA